MAYKKEGDILKDFQYSPYCNLKWLVWMLVLDGGILLFFVVSHYTDKATKVVLASLIGCVIICLVEFIVLVSITITLGEIGIRLERRIPPKEICLGWQEFRYAYYVYDYKGRRYLLLSPTLINKDMIGNYFRKALHMLLKGKLEPTPEGCVCLKISNSLSTVEHILSKNSVVILRGPTGDGTVY